ncbi:alpha/beta fold hydrolase [Phycicoccus sp. KQZ13P-1]|uniref:alpha/beta fold hydrolase n=1 Tax=Phycicoccus mangrovi TaxID=2840470 RepID=UPI001C006B08|nr:alpha/beta fold hydrolase [Phycicoccus mangrovi]MBT9255275.1 alpha/beta fold hydrolase [Phycicoccus mangrovi]
MTTFDAAWAARREGHLDVGDGQRIWWCEFGAADGIPLLVVHGGPGGGSVPAMAAPYDPDVFRIVMFDQRGCGRSVPHASDPGVSLATNTTPALVSDMEHLREDRGIFDWIVSGGSWGATLALAYTCRHPHRVRAILLRSITTYSSAELRWVYVAGANHLLPEAWDSFAGMRDRANLIERYRHDLEGTDDRRRAEAALEWCRWELAGMRAAQGSEVYSLFMQPRFSVAFSRISAHYAAHQGFIDHDDLWAQVPTLSDIPATFIQGRFDLCTPPVTAWRLHRAWSGSTLHLLEDEGHRLSDVANLLRATLQRYASMTE